MGKAEYMEMRGGWRRKECCPENDLGFTVDEARELAMML